MINTVLWRTASESTHELPKIGNKYNSTQEETSLLKEEETNDALCSEQSFTYISDDISVDVKDNMKASVDLQHDDDSIYRSIDLKKNNDSDSIYRIIEPNTVAALKWEIIPYQICRLCASTNELHPKQSIVGWLNMLNMVLPNVVLLNDGLPQHICRPCTNKLYTCNKIVEGFLEADLKLQTGMGFTKTEGLGFLYGPSTSNNDRGLGLHECYSQGLTQNLEATVFDKSGELTECNSYKYLQHDIQDLSMKEDSSKECNVPEVENEKNNEIEKHVNILQYKCNKCESLFTSEKELHYHEQTHTNSEVPSKFVCEFCNEHYSQKCLLLDHLHVHAEEKCFVCEYCGKVYQSNYLLRNHQKNHSPPKLVCPVCGVMFQTWTRYKHHKKKHSSTDKFICEFCGKTLSTPGSLKTHRRIHTGEKPYKCSTCDMCFISAGMLSQHSFAHIEKCFYCDICGKEFCSKKRLILHQQSHNEQKPYKCPLCLESFSTMGNRGRHLRVTCTNIHCVVCKQTFPSIEMVEEHRIKQHSKKEVLIAANLYRIRQFARCKICFELVPGNNNMKKHMRKFHSDYKPFACDKCSKCFLTKQQLLSHGISHSNQRPFPCPICHIKFKSKETLKWHDISFHQDVFPFSCPYCNRKFKRQTSLIVHKRTHTGERPYPCPMCKKAFPNKGDMVKHTKTHYSKKRLKNITKDEQREDTILEMSGYIWDLSVAEEVIV